MGTKIDFTRVLASPLNYESIKLGAAAESGRKVRLAMSLPAGLSWLNPVTRVRMLIKWEVLKYEE